MKELGNRRAALWYVFRKVNGVLEYWSQIQGWVRTEALASPYNKEAAKGICELNDGTGILGKD